MVLTELWGGSVLVNLPNSSNFIDVSNLRDVPNNQEVFVEATEGSTLDRSLIFEVVEYQQIENTDVQRIGMHFWNDFVEENNAIENAVGELDSTGSSWVFNISKIELPCSEEPGYKNRQVIVASGVQDIPRSAGKIDRVVLHVGILRLPSVQSEILLTYHYPLPYITPLQVDQIRNQVLPQTYSCFEKIISSLEVKDWNLFGQQPNQ